MSAIGPIKKESLQSAGRAPAPLEEKKPPVVAPYQPQNSESTSLSGRVVTDETHTAKKKKKKKPSAAQQSAVAQQLGATFHAQPHVEIASKSSIFQSEYCPKFNQEEQAILQSMLNQWGPCQSINLFDLFIADFFTTLEQILSLSNESFCDADTKKALTTFYKKGQFFKSIFATYLSLFGQSSECQEDVQSNLNIALLRKIPEQTDFLSAYSQELKRLIVHIEQSLNLRTLGKSKAVQALMERKAQPFLQKLNLLNQKTVLLVKCLEAKDPITFLVTTQVGIWAETDCPADINSRQHLLNVFTTYVSFLQNFFSIGKELEIEYFTPKSFEDFLKIIQEMIAANFSKKSIATFMTTYKHFSSILLSLRTDFIGYLNKAKNDPSFTYQNYCEEKKHTDKRHVSNQEFILSMIHANLAAEIIDKWTNNLNEILSVHFLSDLEGSYFRPPRTYMDRLMVNFELVQNIGPESIPEDTFIQQLHGKVSEKLREPADLLGKIVQDIDFSFIAACLNQKLSIASFRLSTCQLALLPIWKRTLNLHRVLSYLDPIRISYLEAIRQAKETGQLDHWESSQLKVEIQKHLFHQAMQMCAYIMILADVDKVFSASTPNDVTHLLPIEMVRFLDLEGFDDIFAKPLELPVPVPAEPELTTPVYLEPSLSAPAEPKRIPKPMSLPLQKESSALPTKRDFQETTKRRVIVRMLEEMGFVYARSGKGSHELYHHPESSGQVVVPHSTEAIGTRVNIFEQARQALKPNDDSKKDN